MTAQRPVALITKATGYVGPALARTLAMRGFDLALQWTDGGSMVGVDASFAEQLPVIGCRPVSPSISATAGAPDCRQRAPLRPVHLSV